MSLQFGRSASAPDLRSSSRLLAREAAAGGRCRDTFLTTYSNASRASVALLQVLQRDALLVVRVGHRVACRDSCGSPTSYASTALSFLPACRYELPMCTCASSARSDFGNVLMYGLEARRSRDRTGRPCSRPCASSHSFCGDVPSATAARRRGGRRRGGVAGSRRRAGVDVGRHRAPAGRRVELLNALPQRLDFLRRAIRAARCCRRPSRGRRGGRSTGCR